MSDLQIDEYILQESFKCARLKMETVPHLDVGNYVLEIYFKVMRVVSYANSAVYKSMDKMDKTSLTEIMNNANK